MSDPKANVEKDQETLPLFSPADSTLEIPTILSPPQNQYQPNQILRQPIRSEQQASVYSRRSASATYESGKGGIIPEAQHRIAPEDDSLHPTNLSEIQNLISIDNRDNLVQSLPSEAAESICQLAASKTTSGPTKPYTTDAAAIPPRLKPSMLSRIQKIRAAHLSSSFPLAGAPQQQQSGQHRMNEPDAPPGHGHPGRSNTFRLGFPGSPQTTSRRTGRGLSRSLGNANASGSVNRPSTREQRPKYAGAIFVHAGAGFHSHQNERLHLRACNDAATMAMKFLRSGASATDAVEAALRVLEDKEITNAGYGSNLSIDGTVECDATIVDHLGRSGACGAVPNVRNPICLAKLILDKSKQPMTLRRVPPNILVGDGARNFAVEHGMLVVPNESLISKNSRDRFLHWQDDLRRADERLKQGGESQKVYGPEIAPSNLASSQPHGTFLSTPTDQMRSGFPQQGDHAHAILLGTWNEGQPDSPYHGPPESECRPGASPITPLNAGLIEPRAPPPPEQCHLDSANNVNSPRGRRASPAKMSSLEVHSILESQPHERDRDGGRSPRLEEGGTRPTNEGQREPQQAPRGIKRPFPFPAGTDDAKHTMDVITDTIGAIAIDAKGTIAAGSSSGGIGMKHRGRLGPAALVGVGTAVVPCDPDDPDGVCVATVTSGTGEHMATTMASQRCAERIYRNTRRGPRGQDVQEDDEDAIMESFIKDDFMGHPGVKNCNPVGAIGLMTVKKTRGGCYLYFAHNTDSFALASMGSSDKEPQCVMSRLGDVSQVTRGARKVALE